MVPASRAQMSPRGPRKKRAMTDTGSLIDNEYDSRRTSMWTTAHSMRVKTGMKYHHSSGLSTAGSMPAPAVKPQVRADATIAMAIVNKLTLRSAVRGMRFTGVSGCWCRSRRAWLDPRAGNCTTP